MRSSFSPGQVSTFMTMVLTDFLLSYTSPDDYAVREHIITTTGRRGTTTVPTNFNIPPTSCNNLNWKLAVRADVPLS